MTALRNIESLLNEINEKHPSTVESLIADRAQTVWENSNAVGLQKINFTQACRNLIGTRRTNDWNRLKIVNQRIVGTSAVLDIDLIGLSTEGTSVPDEPISVVIRADNEDQTKPINYISFNKRPATLPKLLSDFKAAYDDSDSAALSQIFAEEVEFQGTKDNQYRQFFQEKIEDRSAQALEVISYEEDENGIMSVNAVFHSAAKDGSTNDPNPVSFTIGLDDNGKINHFRSNQRDALDYNHNFDFDT